MTPAAIASLMMLTSGAAHAVVNAVLKSGKDKMSSRALIDGFFGADLSPPLFLPPLPSARLGLAGGVSGVIHLVYLVSLIKAFESADMMVAYPLMRGLAPMLASAVSVTACSTTPVTVPRSWIGAGVACRLGGRDHRRRSAATSIGARRWPGRCSPAPRSRSTPWPTRKA